jgi:hypothetical protein
MSSSLQNPETKRGDLRAVAFSQVDVSVFDDSVNPEKEVFHCATLDEAVAFMDAVNPYLAAFSAFAESNSEATKRALEATFPAIEKSAWKSAAITIAFRRDGDLVREVVEYLASSKATNQEDQ